MNVNYGELTYLCRMKDCIALIEFGGSHDECLLTQMEALQKANAKIVWVTNRALYERNRHLHGYCSETYFVEPTGKAIGDWKQMRQLVKFLQRLQVMKAVFNTAQGGHVRNLALLLPKSITAYGIIHTVRKFEGSFTQKLIHRKIRKYLVLSDDLLSRIKAPEGIAVSSFYPVQFPRFRGVFEKPEGVCLVTITGGVENRRKDLASVVPFLETTPENIHFVFLGKTDPEHPDARGFLERVKAAGLEKRMTVFTEFVSSEIFDAYLQNTDFLLPLIHPGTPSADQYINNQISGAFSIAYGYHIPLLIHAHYATESDLRIAAHFYETEQFAADLQHATDCRNDIAAKIAAVQKWKPEFQHEHYLRFLEISSVKTDRKQ